MLERTAAERHQMEHNSVDDGEQYQCSICGYYDEDNAGPPYVSYEEAVGIRRPTDPGEPEWDDQQTALARREGGY